MASSPSFPPLQTSGSLPPLMIGTRGSPLALAQARLTRARIAEALGLDVDLRADPGRETDAIRTAVIRTTGDAVRDRPLSDIGGKGLFTKEIDEAQLRGEVHVAVHSAKDLPPELPPGLVIAGYLPREDARDVLIGATSLEALPEGARVGTASLRRQALLLRARPDLTVSLLRGNVETRLARVASGAIDATVLALAGLKRLGLEARADAALDENEFPPAAGQGAIALVTREDDARALEAVAAVADAATGACLAAERAFLARLDGSCRTPIAGHARLVGDRLVLSGLLLTPDGREAYGAGADAPVGEAVALGLSVGDAVLRRRDAARAGGTDDE